MKSFDQKMQESQSRINRELAKQKSWIAAENAKKRKERNARLFASGAYVEHVLGVPNDDESIDEYKNRIGRLLRIGMAAEEVLQREVDPMHLKFFLIDQQERGNYFSKFMNKKAADTDMTN